MLNISYTEVSSYNSLSKCQQGELDSFIIGAIQGFTCGNKLEDGSNPVFAIADIVGGMFRNWEGTPLNYIYEYHKARGCLKPEDEAGKDMGRIFKYIMGTDKYRNYKLVRVEQRKYPANMYQLVGLVNQD